MNGGEHPSEEAPAGYVIGTYREIAERLGLSGPDAARIRAKRAGWEREIPNHPLDPIRVRVPITVWEQPLIAPPRSSRARTLSSHTDLIQSAACSGRTSEGAPPNISGDHPLLKGLSDALDALRSQLGREQLRADAAELEARELRRLADQRTQDMAELRERLARAEAERDHAKAERERVEQQAGELWAELSSWKAGGPLARALRAFLGRR